MPSNPSSDLMDFLDHDIEERQVKPYTELCPVVAGQASPCRRIKELLSRRTDDSAARFEKEVLLREKQTRSNRVTQEARNAAFTTLCGQHLLKVYLQENHTRPVEDPAELLDMLRRTQECIRRDFDRLGIYEVCSWAQTPPTESTQEFFALIRATGRSYELETEDDLRTRFATTLTVTNRLFNTFVTQMALPLYQKTKRAS